MISIIIAMYNMEKYIEECLQSIFKQDFQNFEVIVVDDGSTDKSVEIAKNYKIRLISQTNQGQAAARNHALKFVQGDYICYVDADDFIEPDALGRMYRLITETDSDMIITGYANVFENEPGRIQIFEPHGESGRIYTGQEVAEMMLKEQVRGFLVNKLFRKDLIQRVNFHQEPGKYIEDLYPVFEAVINSKRIAFLDGYTYNYRQREDSSSNEKHEKLMFDYLDAAKLVLNRAQGLNTKAIEAFEAITFLSLVNYYGLAHLEKGFGIYQADIPFKRPKLWRTLRNSELSLKRKLSLLLWDLRVYHLALGYWNRKKFGR